MPLATQSGASSLEIYECDLDFSLGLYPNNTTFTWNPSGSGTGCVEPQLYSGITSPLAGPGSSGYPNAMAGAVVGQPTNTGTQTQNTVLIHGTQY
jgi:hypothetical protein